VGLSTGLGLDETVAVPAGLLVGLAVAEALEQGPSNVHSEATSAGSQAAWDVWACRHW